MKIVKGKTYLNVGSKATKGCIVKVTELNYSGGGHIKYDVIKESENAIEGEWAHCHRNSFKDYFVPVDRKVKRLK